MITFDKNKLLIRKMIIEGAGSFEISKAIGVSLKKYDYFINNNRDARKFINSCIGLREENLIDKIASSNKWHSAKYLLEVQNPKKYSGTMNVKDIEKFYRQDVTRFIEQLDSDLQKDPHLPIIRRKYFCGFVP